MSLLTILIILLVVSAVGGYWGGGEGRPWGRMGWSPLGILLVILLVLLLTGNLGSVRLR